MEPRLRSGDFALFLRCRDYQVGDIVLVDHPSLGLIVKQIRTLAGDRVTLEGTGAFSTSSAKMGAVPLAAIRGKLLWRFQSKKAAGERG